MSADTITAIKKALEGVRQSAWFMSPWHIEEDASAVRNSDDFSYICNASSDDFAAYIASVNPPAVLELISEINRLRNKVPARALTDRQLADEIKAVDEVCKGGFGEGGGSPGEAWYERADELEHERKRRELENQLQQHNSRTALASTGGEHHAE